MRKAYKIFALQVDTAGQAVTKKFDLDRNAKLVYGIALTSNRPNLLFYRGSQRIEVSGEEIFPEGYESKMLMSGLGVAPEDKFVVFQGSEEVLVGNGEVKVQYKDTENPAAPFEPYTVSIILQCEMQAK